MPAALQHIQEAAYVGIHIGPGILYGIPDTCLGCQIYDQIVGFAGKQPFHANSVLKQQAMKHQIWMEDTGTGTASQCLVGVQAQLRQAGMLEGRVVIIIDGVQSYNLVSTPEQGFCHMITNETGATGQ